MWLQAHSGTVVNKKLLKCFEAVGKPISDQSGFGLSIWVFGPAVVFLFDLVWFACMTPVPASTNKVYICLFPPTLTRWMGHLTVPIIKLYKVCRAQWLCASGTFVQPGWLHSCSGFSGSSSSWLLITARCSICCRRIMFPILTTVLVQIWSSFVTALNVTPMFEYPPVHMFACV